MSDELLERIAIELAAGFAYGPDGEQCPDGANHIYWKADRILALLPPMPKLEWRYKEADLLSRPMESLRKDIRRLQKGLSDRGIAVRVPEEGHPIGVDAITAAFRAIDTLRGELDAERQRIASYRMLDHSQQAMISSLSREDRRDHVARATLDGEREANALLTEEVERLRAAGPVMPETPSEAMLRHIINAGHNYIGEEHMSSLDRARRAWDAIRAALAKEQGL